VALAIHVDWHLARHHGRLSGGWREHWAFAIPVFALAGWYAARRCPHRLGVVSASTLALAVLLAQVLEPLGEYVFFRWPLNQGFGPARQVAFGLFLAAGLPTYALVALTVRRWGEGRRPPIPH
jgi:hypothetical protein